MKAVVIGSSAGGPVALRQLLPRLCPTLGGAVIVMSHLGPGGSDLLVAGLGTICRLPVRLAMEREPVKGGVIHVAPDGYHLLIEPDRRFSYSVDERVSFSRPSIDVLFTSAARVYRAELIGVVLSGANADGAEGASAIRDFGGRVLIQDPQEAEMPKMPLAAMARAGFDLCDSVANLADYINCNVD